MSRSPAAPPTSSRRRSVAWPSCPPATAKPAPAGRPSPRRWTARTQRPATSWAGSSCLPASTLNVDPATGRKGRWPLHPTTVQRAMKAAVRKAGIPRHATCHTLRHSFATEALRGGCDIRTLQHVLGHRDIRTTMLYLHVVEQTGAHVRSPFDQPDAGPADPHAPPTQPLRRQWETAAAEATQAARALARAHAEAGINQPRPHAPRGGIGLQADGRSANPG